MSIKREYFKLGKSSRYDFLFVQHPTENLYLGDGPVSRLTRAKYITEIVQGLIYFFLNLNGNREVRIKWKLSMEMSIKLYGFLSAHKAFLG